MAEEVAVASVVYNLAGQESKRPSYLKSVVVNGVLGNEPNLGESIIVKHLVGPAARFRNYYNWCLRDGNYSEIGLQSGNLELVGSIDGSLVAPHISVDPGDIAWVQSAVVSYADILKWAEQWILQNDPGNIDDAWIADYDATLNQITITFTDTSTQTFTPSNFDDEAKYIFANYTVVSPDTTGTPTTGDVVNLGPGESFPDVTGWTFISSDAGPPAEEVYELETLITDGLGNVFLKTETMYQWDDSGTLSYRVDIQLDPYTVVSGQDVFIYKIGSGNTTLDALAETGADYGYFFPYMPLRLENKFLSKDYKPTAYRQVRKAYKKATGGEVKDIIKQLKKNDDLDDIDHAYIVFGVSLNVIEPACKKYLYEFFRSLTFFQNGGPNAYSEFTAAMAAQDAVVSAYVSHFELGGTEEDAPPAPNWPEQKMNSVKVGNIFTSNEYKYRTSLEFAFMEETFAAGKGKVGAKKGDLWFEVMPDDEYVEASRKYSNQAGFLDLVTYDITYSWQKVRLYWQYSDSNHKYIDIVGATHLNYVYGNRTVFISAQEALADEDESGFIVPMHYNTWKSMSIINTTQMSTACCFLVLNCYEVVKKKWYQTGIFRVVLVVVVAVVAVVFTGGAGIGLLGSHLAVGSALGFTGLTAAVVGSVVNALAAVVLMTVLNYVTQGLGIFGQILSVLIMFAVGQIAASFQNVGSLSINWGELVRADNLLQLTSAVGNGVAQQIQLNTQNIYSDMSAFIDRADEESARIRKAYLNEFGYGNGQINPLMFTDSSASFSYESSSSFLSRTLMTGSEIAEMSRELVYNFPEYTLTLPNAFT